MPGRPISIEEHLENIREEEALEEARESLTRALCQALEFDIEIFGNSMWTIDKDGKRFEHDVNEEAIKMFQEKSRREAFEQRIKNDAKRTIKF